MYELDSETRRNLHYAALPGKAVASFVVFILCLAAGLFGTTLVAYPEARPSGTSSGASNAQTNF